MKINENTLHKYIQQKDTRALEYLIDTYSKTVSNLIYQILGNISSKQDIEECASDVFVRVWNDIEEYCEEKGAFKTWIFMKAKYIALDKGKKLKKRLNRELLIEDYSPVYLSKDQISEAPEKEYISKENKENIMRLINNLKGKDREVFIRRFYFYQEIEDIARTMNTTRKAVDTRIWRIRKGLKEQIEKEELSIWIKLIILFTGY